MNVQFSLTASSSISKSAGAESNNSYESASHAKLTSYRDVKGTVEKQGEPVSIAEGQLIRTIEQAVKSLQGPQTTLEISIHEKTHDIMVKVLNKDTGELIREIPPEKTLDLVAKMMEIAGILVDEKI
ncbi:flagellar protein FlaG [Paenibacillus polysaccharolyticus]|uniref:flagellar protein FlaG n=1 Tax=Paenibacillus polysaccharolyticus TaxID=582692 RepID=UPI00300B352C